MAGWQERRQSPQIALLGDDEVSELPVTRPLDLYLQAVSRVESGQVSHVELVTITRNPITAETHVFSQLAGRVADWQGPTFSEGALYQDLKELLKQLTDDPDASVNLTTGLGSETPDYTDRKIGYDDNRDVRYHEWQAITKNVFFGIAVSVDERGPYMQTWYVAKEDVETRMQKKDLPLRLKKFFKRYLSFRSPSHFPD